MNHIARHSLQCSPTSDKTDQPVRLFNRMGVVSDSSVKCERTLEASGGQPRLWSVVRMRLILNRFFFLRQGSDSISYGALLAFVWIQYIQTALFLMTFDITPNSL